MTSSELKSQADRAHALLNERQKVTQAIVAAETAFENAETDYQSALTAIGTAEAGSALGESSDLRSAQKKLTSAKDAKEYAPARIEGLQRKLLSNASAMELASAALGKAIFVDAEEVLAEHRERILAGIGALRKLVCEGLTLSLAVNDQEYSRWMRSANFPDITNSSNLLVASATGSLTEPPWTGDADLERLYTEKAAPVQLKKSMDLILQQLRDEAQSKPPVAANTSTGLRAASGW